MKRQWNILAGNNRGSGIIVVLISMVCVGLMGASLMFMSYTAIRMKATERQASKDFYSAETAVDEIRAGVQTAVSEAIASSYKYVLETYGDSDDIEDRFETRFLVDLQNTGLLQNSGNNYNVTKLENYVSNLANPADANASGVRVRSAASSVTKVTKDSEIINLVLNGIEVEYTAANGYTTKISTDLSISMPKFVYTTTSTNFSGLPQHALIAKTALDHTSGDKAKIAITGSAYAGSINLKVANSQLAIKNGTLVCAGNVAVSGSGPDTLTSEEKPGRLVTDNTVKFWAERIEVNGGSSVNLNGETRVLDDLELAGAKAEATLGGIYYGFGDGSLHPHKDYETKADGSKTPKVTPSKRSSAILVNGANSKLDFSSLKQLILAGRAYISDSLYGVQSGGTKGVPTVESISVRSNQQMYLIDPRYLEIDKEGTKTSYVSVTENPIIIDNTIKEPGNLTDSGRIRLKATDEDGNEIKIKNGSLTYRMYKISNDQSIVYCYMEFNDPSVENEYFEKYFKEHADDMSRYLVDDKNDENGENDVLSNLNLTAGSIYSLGYSIQNNSNTEGAYSISRPSGKINSAGMRSTFNQLTTTLVDANTEPGEGIDNPYDYIVNTAKLNQLSDNEVRKFTWTGTDEAGNDITVEGVVTKGNYVINDTETTGGTTGTQSNLRLVIAGGNVTVTKNYNGLIICGGTIKIQGEVDMSAKPKDVMHVFDAVYVVDPSDRKKDIKLREYLRDGITGSDNGASGSGSWNLDTLVTYKNWTKS